MTPASRSCTAVQGGAANLANPVQALHVACLRAAVVLTSWKPALKTHSLVAAVATVLLLGCAAPTGKKTEPAFVGVHLLGEHAFCVYDLWWEIEGLKGSPNDGPAVLAKCTPDSPTRKGTFVNDGGGHYYVALLPTTLVVHYRREMDGPRKTARFNLAALPVPAGYRVISLTPYIKPTGAQLWVYVEERAGNLRDRKAQLLQLPQVNDE